MSLLAVGAILGSLALAACGGSSSSGAGGGDVTITFWDDNGGPARTPIWQHIISDFQAANPHIKVNYVGVGTSAIEQKYNTAIAGGGVPDVGMASSQYLTSLIAQQALVPLDSQYSAGDLNGKIDKAMLDSARKNSPDQKLYIMPLTTTLDTLYWRTDWFKSAGLEPPKTWDDFFADAKKLTDTSKGHFGYTLRGGPGGTLQLLGDLLSYIAPKDFFDSNGKAVIDSPQAAEFVGKLADLYHSGEAPKADINNGYQQMVSEFDGGTVAMMRHNLGSYNDHAKSLGTDKFDGASLPIGPGGTPVAVYPGANGPVIFKASKHQKEAWTFVDFVLSHAENSYWNQQSGQIPANTDAQKDSWVSQERPLADTLKRLDDPTTVVLEAPHYLPQFGQIMDVDMAPLWQKVIGGQMTPQAFLTKWADEFTAAKKQYDSSHH